MTELTREKFAIVYEAISNREGELIKTVDNLKSLVNSDNVNKIVPVIEIVNNEIKELVADKDILSKYGKSKGYIPIMRRRGITDYSFTQDEEQKFSNAVRKATAFGA